MPIRTQALLLFNLIVMLLTVVFAWRAASVASQAVRKRIVQQTASNTAAFLATQNIPMGDHLLSQLNRMFDVQFVAIEKTTGKLLGTSLQDASRSLAAHEFKNLPDDGELVLDRTRFLYHADKTLRTPTGPAKKETVLYVLIPESQLTQAATTAFWGVVRFGVFVLIGGSVLTWFFAEQFTRPIRNLARAMDDPAHLPPRPAGTSDEIRLLYRSFAQLLDRQEKSQQVLVDSERLVAIGRMAAAVAHELRNPLSGIKMNLQVLRDELESDPAVKNDPSLELALQEVDRMELYLKELMHLVVPASRDVAEPVRGENHPTCQPAEAIRAVLMLFAGRLRHAAIHVDVDLPDDVPRVRLSDSEYRQVLANLLINAIEATPEQGTIRISAHLEPGEKAGEGGGNIDLSKSSDSLYDRKMRPYRPDFAGFSTMEGLTTNATVNRIKTTVSDSGSGVVLRENEDPFQIFTSTKVDGTGLGLYICKRIIHNAAGQIGYENHADKPGATFWFGLPEL